MRFNPLLFHKLIAIVLIPLVFEVVLAASLFGMLAKAETQATNERKARQASADLNDLYQRITATAQLVAGVVLKEGTLPNIEAFTQEESIIAGDVRNIRELAHGDRDTTAQIDELEANVNASLRIVDEVLNDIESGNRFMTVPRLKHLKGTVPVITSKLTVLRAHFDQTADDEFYSQKRNRKTIQNLLLAGIVINVAIVFAFLLYIYRNITSRLQIVMENTRRLVRDEELLPPLPGDDEIAHLDKTFKDMASALQTARKRREEIERVKQEFVSMISHDLRTPLTSIQMFLNMLTKGMLGVTNDKMQQKAAMADRNATRLIGMINDLLDVEKMESGQLTLTCVDVELEPIAEKALESVRTYAEQQGVTVSSTMSGDLRVHAEADRLVQVLINLLGNAVKFSASGKQVILDAKRDGEMVRVTVKDEGRGIPSHLLESVFDRFKQVEAKDATEKKGTGLGLAICKAIVEGHNGTIGVESAEGKGSIFWFTVPAAKTGAISTATPVCEDTQSVGSGA